MSTEWPRDSKAWDLSDESERSKTMTKYVLGFLYQDDGVWLIRKNRPEWQKGKLNGIGGKIEEGESEFDAMRRECREEAGIEIDSWSKFCLLTDGENFEMYCFYSFSTLTPGTMTDEKVEWYHLKGLPNDTIPNIHWLIPISLSFGKGESAKEFYIKEIK